MFNKHVKGKDEEGCEYPLCASSRCNMAHREEECGSALSPMCAPLEQEDAPPPYTDTTSSSSLQLSRLTVLKALKSVLLALLEVVVKRRLSLLRCTLYFVSNLFHSTKSMSYFPTFFHLSMLCIYFSACAVKIYRNFKIGLIAFNVLLIFSSPANLTDVGA